jgi:hypothetical protein
MTAVVGILNTGAVAIAADSAVTVTGPTGQKIYNTGNKIFQLSKKHPIGIAIYGSGSLMVTPWEVIIKSFRKNLGDGKFGTVIEYRDSFLEFLRTSNYFTTGIGSAIILRDTIIKVLNGLGAVIEQRISSLFPNVTIAALTAVQKQQIHNVSKTIVNDKISQLVSLNDNLGDFGSLTELEFINEVNTTLAVVDPTLSVESVWGRHPVNTLGLADVDLLDLIKSCLYQYFKKDDFVLSSYTGLVFVGYGDDEIYPQSHCIEASEVLGTRIRWRMHSNISINESLRANIIPFAQSDVILTMLNGLAPKLENQISVIMRDLMNQFTKEVSDIVRPAIPSLAKQLDAFNVETLITEFSNNLNALKRSYFVTPTLDAVTLFSKEDLAEMAESLVYLTYLQKRMTLDPETVSKPVDVAVISKNDGFVWIKRKYYFEQALNPHFLRNYFE